RNLFYPLLKWYLVLLWDVKPRTSHLRHAYVPLSKGVLNQAILGVFLAEMLVPFVYHLCCWSLHGKPMSGSIISHTLPGIHCSFPVFRATGTKLTNSCRCWKQQRTPCGVLGVF
uniref:Uncharacterized protein n=1 Tax=Corvus moneduloides TaxID=1196302 RepID=A0A8U7M3X8_CORMO